MKKIQIAFRVHDEMIKQLESYVDGVKFRNRSHAIEVILKEWLDNEAKKRKGVQTSLLDLKPQAKSKKKK